MNQNLKRAIDAVRELRQLGAVEAHVDVEGTTVRARFAGAPADAEPPPADEPTEEERRKAAEDLAYWSVE